MVLLEVLMRSFDRVSLGFGALFSFCVAGCGGDSGASGVATEEADLASRATGDIVVSAGGGICPAVSNAVYFVDPVKGSDSGTGAANGTSSCAFKTLTHAVNLVRASAAPAKIVLLADDPGLGESFPIALPSNLELMGGRFQGGTLTPAGFTITAGASKDPVPLAAAFVATNVTGIHIHDLVVQGATGASGSPPVAGLWTRGTGFDVTIDSVVFRRFVRAFYVGTPGFTSAPEGTLHIGGDSSAEESDTGLEIVGRANVDLAHLGANAAAFGENTSYGIYVHEGGTMDARCPSPATPSTSTLPTLTSGRTETTLGMGCVWVVHNGVGVRVGNTPSLAAESVLDGVFVRASAGHDAVVLEGGSKVLVRNSVTEAEPDFVYPFSGSGVRVQTLIQKDLKGGFDDDISGIDLGRFGDAGHNRFQYRIGGDFANAGTGICLAIGGSGQQLSAQGNVLTDGSGATVDCSATKSIVSVGDGCSGQTSISPGTNRIDILGCR